MRIGKKTRRVLIEFYKDPEKNPLKTPTGKLEFYSEKLAKYFPDDEGETSLSQVDTLW